MRFIKINSSNVDTEHFGCALSNKDETSSKREWIKENLKNDYTFLKLDARGKVFIEYVPLDNACTCIKGDNYLFIDCFWVSGSFKNKGIGKELLTQCLNEAKQKGYNGVVALSAKTKKPFLSDPKFYKKHGFEVVDTFKPYYELLCLKFKDAKNPEFISNEFKYSKDGICIIYSQHCPFTKSNVEKIKKVVEKFKIPFEAVKIDSIQKGKEAPNPFTTYSFYDNGEFITNEIFSEKKLLKYLETREISK
ncbi:ribosomal protein S18 acetylase RimI-like enzyme [Bacilli bacterium PM5-3]|nr:ribosomal protein S18 acetylase RimI-like enzyme [Bacilli bacterium PM5-3]MDH6604122.1 ribosomal protein S18 acetylase RimI-like enzyme [Bacilli bacterium PM5-9]